MPYPEAYQKVLNADLLIRPLVPEDVPAVLDVERQGYSHPWSESVFLDCFKDNYRVWGACHGGDLVGYAVLAYIVDEAHLLNICVHPRARGEGVGRYLLRHVLEPQPMRVCPSCCSRSGSAIMLLSRCTRMRVFAKSVCAPGIIRPPMDGRMHAL